jgi:hypothetical protein
MLLPGLLCDVFPRLTLMRAGIGKERHFREAEEFYRSDAANVAKPFLHAVDFDMMNAFALAGTRFVSAILMARYGLFAIATITAVR